MDVDDELLGIAVSLAFGHPNLGAPTIKREPHNFENVKMLHLKT
jgi:hypothetical protein